MKKNEGTLFLPILNVQEYKVTLVFSFFGPYAEIWPWPYIHTEQ